MTPTSVGARSLTDQSCMARQYMYFIGKTIHPHPTLGESIGLAAEVAHGSCADLPAMKKK